MNIKIKIEDGVAPDVALDRVKRVIRMGQVSESSGIRHYCWVTEFFDVMVYVNRKRKPNSADSFVVRSK